MIVEDACVRLRLEGYRPEIVDDRLIVRRRDGSYVSAFVIVKDKIYTENLTRFLSQD